MFVFSSVRRWHKTFTTYLVMSLSIILNDIIIILNDIIIRLNDVMLLYVYRLLIVFPHRFMCILAHCVLAYLAMLSICASLF